MEMETIQPTYPAHQKTSTEIKLLFVFAFITIAGIIINAVNSAFWGLENPFIQGVEYVSNFTDSVLALFIGSKILTLSGSFYTTIGLSVFFYIMFLIIESTGLAMFFFSFGVLIFFATFFLVMRVYDTGFLKTLLLFITQAAIVFVINITVFGLYKVLSLFA